MTNAYGAASGDGTISNSGMTREAARRRAQEIADQTGETAEVYEEPSGETVEVIEPSERHDSCECGDVTGTPCGWRGPRADTVLVEYMPEHLREGHAAAGGAGVYPVNGAVRIRCERSCAEAIVETEDGWAEIVEVQS